MGPPTLMVGEAAELVAVEVPEVGADDDAVGGPAFFWGWEGVIGLSERSQHLLPKAVGDGAVVNLGGEVGPGYNQHRLVWNWFTTHDGPFCEYQPPAALF